MRDLRPVIEQACEKAQAEAATKMFESFAAVASWPATQVSTQDDPTRNVELQFKNRMESLAKAKKLALAVIQPKVNGY